MKTIKSILVIASIVCVGMAQEIKITGTVKDRAGAGIEGADVLLEKSGLKDSTKADGSFTLTNVPTTIRQGNPSQLSNGIFFTQHNRKMNFSLSERAVVKVDIYNLQGSNIASVHKAFDAGPQHLSLPDIDSKGISFYRVKIGESEYMFKCALSSQMSSISSMASTQGTSGVLSKQAMATVLIDDIIKVTKAGFLNYRGSVTNSDTSGIVITMLYSAGAVTDIDGNVYHTVKIGNQEWTVENLRTTKYNDGTTIPHVTGKTEWKNLTTPGYCYYGNDSTSNAEKYGALYNWYAVDTKKLAPTGWRVPTDADWRVLENYLIANGYNWDGTTSGNKIAKAIAAKTDWDLHENDGAIGNDLSKNNASGFSALPGDSRNHYGEFDVIGYYGRWWSATEFGAGGAWDRRLGFGSGILSGDYRGRGFGLSVRLLRD